MTYITKDVTIYSPNGTVVGSPVFDKYTGIMSGFSAGNYLNVANTITNNSSFEIKLHLKTSGDVTTNQNYYSTTDASINRVSLGIDHGHFRFFAGTSGESWDIANAVTGTYSVLTNKEYYIKFSFNGSTYVLSYSLDGENYTTDCSVTSSLIVGNYIPNLGCRENGTTSFTGSIYLKDCSIKLNGTSWWDGTTSTTKTYYGERLNVNKGLPYTVVARGEGYWDNLISKTFTTSGQETLLDMVTYDGLDADYETSYQSADTIDFSETILPWKIQYSNLLETSKFCLMPVGGDGFTYQNIVEIKDKLNATFVGSPTFNTETGIVSGFSASNYVTLGNLSMASYNTWSFETEFTTGNVVNETQAIFIENNTGWNSGFNIGGTGNIHIGLSSAHSGNDIGEVYTTTILSPNTTYNAKLEFTGTAYNFYLNNVLEATITSSTKLSDHVWNIGCTNNSDWPIAFLGSVNLKKTKFIANSVERILYEKVPVQEPNVTNLDTATNNNGVVSGITSALPMKHSVTFYKNKSFEIYTKLLTTSSVADINEIFVVPNVMLLRTWNNNWNPCFYVNGSWQQISTGGNVYTNSTYYIRCRYFPDTTTVDGKTYTAKNVYFEKSTDNSSWTSIYNTSLATYFFGNDASVTEREIDGAWGAQGSEIWKGSIDFNTAYIKVDGQIVWNGMTNSTISLPGCTANFVDTGASTTLNAFVINNTESVILTPDNSYTNGWLLGTVSIPAHTAYDYVNGTWTEKS